MRYSSSAPIEDSGEGFRALSAVFEAASAATIEAVRQRLESMGREHLLERFQAEFFNGRRLAAYLLADELISREIPPWVWLDGQPEGKHTLVQRCDLMLFDLRWLSHWHREHIANCRYQRYRQLTFWTEKRFLTTAEWIIHKGKRPAWKIVRALSLADAQQLDCTLLRSAPINRRAAATAAMRGQVFRALQDDVASIRRTRTFTSNDALITLSRRRNLWLCSRMSNSPTEVARRYRQLTGEEITRQVAAKQLAKVDEVLRQIRMIHDAERR
ncbi:hypothetical protein [Herbaspirillum sp. ST 5-3]|uniref:hypothetical protein n=1 Tax=Oxalobacteraceae TaxID=75682 RepID=UPI0010A3057D|nr:hypothetical protein [Herbaspirillum sp. ST 5-3]